MGRCNNDILLKKIGMNTLNESTEVDFRIRKDLPDCRKINAKDYVNVSGTAAYNKFVKPVNRFECMRTGCVNTGVLMLEADNELVTYRARFDATEFAAGVITFYVKPADGVVLPAAITFKISDKDDFVNTDIYNVTIDKVLDDGFAPVVIDLSQTPASVDGTGWEATSLGAYFQLTSDKTVGFSSFAIFDSMDDFEVNDVVSVSCLTTIGGTFDVEMVEAQCQAARYNDSITTLQYPVTGLRTTPNYWKLNPMMGKGSNTVGYDMTTIKKTIVAEGTDYGKITIADLNQDVCGYIAVQIADTCDVTDSSLLQLSVPTATVIDEGHYQVIKNADGTTDLLFNKSLVGTEVAVKYPKTVEIEEMVANPENLNGVHVSMTVPLTQSDGVKYLLIFDNVFITSFPATITNENAEFAFTLAIGRDDNGDFFRLQRIIA